MDFVITGASGAGKSTLLAYLKSFGYACREEVGRQLVREQRAVGGCALPDKDCVAFRDLLFERSIAAFDRGGGRSGETVFHDRSFLEAIAYSAIIGASVPESMVRAAQLRRLASPVFVCAPWREIFEHDAERTHGFDFARQDYAANVSVYRAYGYELVDVPQVCVEERARFVIEHLEKQSLL
ncbi:AAA family ATPase [Pseudovibrio sp. Alg231-02]|uniref:AAA family ATPase n=1 Tax=Pseudovibrio sp. Alg231-02 TaxID=1922223 RepID=UPI001AD8DFC3|nr:AAA family ATPase [Pseudovibrio sp. Alg231-02]